MSNIVLPYTQIIDPASFKSVLNAKIYIGEYGVLPNPNNSATWKQAYFVQDDGSRVATSQPIRTNAAGFAVDGSGNIRTVQVDGQYSLIVQDSFGVQKYSNTRVADFSDGVATYAKLRLFNGVTDFIYVGGRTSYFDMASGVFSVDYSDTTSADDDGTILVDSSGRRWKRIYSGSALATWFGARADSGVTDNAPMLNAALASVGSVALPFYGANTWYATSSPVYLDTNQKLEGIGAFPVEVRKTTNTSGTGSNVMGAQTDSYAKDAIVILRHADNVYNNYPRLKNLILNGSTANCDYAVYAPRVAHGVFEDVVGQIGTGLYGWVTHDTYMSRFHGVQMAKGFTVRTGSIGFWWDDQNDGSSGTSCEFINCWARDGFDQGWKLRGLVYSTMSACGSDSYGANALWAELCDMSITSFGFENRVAGSVGSPITLRYGRYDVGSLVGFSVDVGAADYVLYVQGGNVELANIRHTSLSGSTGKSFNVTDSGRLLITGGQAFGSGVVLTPNIDATSRLIDLTTFPSGYQNGTWTPVISGATTAGTYELSTASGRYTRIGNTVTLHCHMVLAGSITGGGSGGIRITGLPVAKGNNTTIPTGAVLLQGVNYTAGTTPIVAFAASGSSSTLYFALDTVNAAPGQIQVSDLAAGDIISFTITYEA